MDEEEVTAPAVPDAPDEAPVGDTPSPTEVPVTPDVPSPDVTPDVPKPPCKWFLVEHRALAGAILPIEAAGKWWHANSQHVLSEAQVALVAKLPGYRVIRDASRPVSPGDCGCGGHA
jgi:hypothetical protein